MEEAKPPGGKECAICGEINMRRMQVNGEMGRAKNLAGLVQKYGEITVSGVMCMKCVRRLLIIHKYATRFYNLCQKKSSGKKEGALPRDGTQLFGVNKPVSDGTNILKITKVYRVQSLPQLQSQFPVRHKVQSDIVRKPLGLQKLDMPLSVLRPIAPKPHQSDTEAASNGSLVGGTAPQSSTSIMDLGSPPNPQELQVNSSVSSQVYESVVTGLTSSIEGSVLDRSGSPPPPKKPKIQPRPDDNWDSTPVGDHTYGKAISAEEILKKHADEWLALLSNDLFCPKSQELISQDDRNILFIKAAEGQLSKIAEAVMRMPKLRARIMACLMSDVSEALSRIANRKRGNLSCLRPKGFEDNMSFDWNSVIREMDMVSPELLKLCMAMLFKPVKSQLNSERMTKETVPKIGIVFAILVQGRIKELTRVQRIISLVLRRNGCNGKAVWLKMNPLGLCLSYTSMITLENGLSANQNPSPSSEINEDETQEDSSSTPAPGNSKVSTLETKTSPAKKPILKVIRRTVASDQGGTTRKISDCPKGDFGASEAVTGPSAAAINTCIMAINNAASQMNILPTQPNTPNTSSGLQPSGTQVSDTR